MKCAAPSTARRQQKLEQTAATTLRAMTGERRLHFRDGRLYRDERPVALPAPHLRLDPAHDDLPAYRGLADGMTMRLRWSDSGLHRVRCPDDPIERLLFELLEQLRVESLAPASLPGIAHNLRRRFVQWSLHFHHSGLTESSLGILFYTVAQVCHARLCGEPVLAETEDLIEATRAAIVPAIGGWLAAMRRLREKQAAYAEPALALARYIGASLRDAGEDSDGETATRQSVRNAFALWLDFDPQDGDALPTAPTGQSKTLQQAGTGYRVFTRRYDSEREAARLVRPALLAEYRARLDRQIAQQGINPARLARQLKALLAEPRRDGWSFGEEDGHLDGRRLALLVSSPTERRVFRQERQPPITDCLVSFLVDCSGSMKTQIEAVARLIDLFARALEQAGSATEVLGFTTGTWNGGRALRDWQSLGRPPHPGRLNEACHLVFKTADTPWRRARRGIAALLKADLFREGIDGEAVEWAVHRMMSRSERRRILIVVSDGSPMDSATHQANDPYYLDHHLKSVIADCEAQGAIEILGIGVGLDLSPFYRHNLALDLSEGLDNRAFTELIQLIGATLRRS